MEDISESTSAPGYHPGGTIALQHPPRDKFFYRSWPTILSSSFFARKTGADHTFRVARHLGSMTQAIELKNRESEDRNRKPTEPIAH